MHLGNGPNKQKDTRDIWIVGKLTLNARFVNKALSFLLVKMGLEKRRIYVDIQVQAIFDSTTTMLTKPN